MLPKEIPHELASSPAGLSIFVVKGLRMYCLQQVVELGAVRIGQTDKPARRVPSRRAGKIIISALLAKMGCSLRPGFLAEADGMNRCREVNGGLPQVTCFAEHKANLQRTPPARASAAMSCQESPAAIRLPNQARPRCCAPVRRISFHILIRRTPNARPAVRRGQTASHPRKTMPIVARKCGHLFFESSLRNRRASAR